jgi:putative hydroxymethylpyrimidine transport system substrate-binding protein
VQNTSHRYARGLMIRVAALLAAALATALGPVACGGEDGAEPGAPDAGATLVLDFTPNAVHAGIYAATERGLLAAEGIELEVVEPTGTADGAKLLEAGRADYAVLDINDFGIARRRGLDVVAVAALVQRPLAAVITSSPGTIREPADLEGATIGVTGVPSDEAVLDSVLADGGLEPGDVSTQTVGFQAAALLASGRLDAATAFWNAEGVELRQQGVATREFRVDEFGAPRFPELLIAAPGDAFGDERPDRGSEVCRFLRGIEAGYGVLADDPASAVEDLAAAVPASDPESQSAQLAELVAAEAFTPAGTEGATAAIDGRAVLGWLRWSEENGLGQRDVVIEGFRDDLVPECAAEGEPLEPDSPPTKGG